MFKVVIPARYGSTRLAAKPLASIGGRPMVQWVHERASASRASDVWVATDHPEIARVVSGFGGKVVLTSAQHPSGTDRVAEVAVQLEWSPEDIVVNVQGDEPLIPPALIDQVAGLLEEDPGAHMSTLCTPIRSAAEFLDPNVVKVCVSTRGVALYFSRAPVPWVRETPPRAGGEPASFSQAYRHIGLYGYRCGALMRLAGLSPVRLEMAEKLEQLRALDAGMRIRVAPAAVLPGQDVNTAEDLQRVREAVPAAPA